MLFRSGNNPPEAALAPEHFGRHRLGLSELIGVPFVEDGEIADARLGDVLVDKQIGFGSAIRLLPQTNLAATPMASPLRGHSQSAVQFSYPTPTSFESISTVLFDSSSVPSGPML